MSIHLVEHTSIAHLFAWHNLSCAISVRSCNAYLCRCRCNYISLMRFMNRYVDSLKCCCGRQSLCNYRNNILLFFNYVIGFDCIALFSFVYSWDVSFVYNGDPRKYIVCDWHKNLLKANLICVLDQNEGCCYSVSDEPFQTCLMLSQLCVFSTKIPKSKKKAILLPSFALCLMESFTKDMYAWRSVDELIMNSSWTHHLPSILAISFSR